MRSFVILLAATAALFAPARQAAASLGGAVASVRTDSQHMGARLESIGMGNYARHQLTRPNGGAVHEYSNARGQVFAVTWSGPGKPDLRSLLGTYFDRYQTANADAGRFAHALRRPPQISQPDLQVQTSGHMGWFRGIAFVPSLAPDGFSAAALAQEQ